MQEGQTILFKNRVELPSIIYVSVPVEDAYYSTPEIQNWSHKHVYNDEEIRDHLLSQQPTERELVRTNKMDLSVV